ncbi:hypothetical protein [Paenibacillus sacheonensis]|uniref:Uncharacterized protein n=1 Tax=Paenibacillus sacheonensis TaxID=742054 RepID=A0A7X4YV46_9BACL|nr:hypothetical protein [Paenibacillus sacheonensis]MBM7565757.1 hypothetical protein [Paenibacillus sacheonensis]NBC72186.1 hypothetical protein [Paenibacillus sacheonensis]
MIVDGIEWVILRTVALSQGRSMTTLNNWYAFAEKNNRLDELPEMRRDFTARETRFVRADQLDRFAVFATTLNRGDLAEFTKTAFGDRADYNKKWAQKKRDEAKAAREAAGIPKGNPWA